MDSFSHRFQKRKESILEINIWDIYIDYADAILDYYTQDNHCLVIDLSTNSTDPEDCIFYTKADAPPPPPKYTLGCKEYWDVSRLKKERTVRQEKIAQQDRHKMKQLYRKNFNLLENWEE